MRRILYVTGSRADFGLMQRALRAIHAHADLELGIIVTGMHLSPMFGSTVAEIEASGLPVVATIPVGIESGTGGGMARCIAQGIEGVVSVLERESAHALLLLGDRGEMLAAAIGAVHLNLPVVHMHGGERTGTVDEPVRHAISKLSHFHFVATPKSRDRLVRMGEPTHRVFVVGAPGLDDLVTGACFNREYLSRRAGLDSQRPIALMVYHPVLQTYGRAHHEVCAILDALADHALQLVCLLPNADAGNAEIREEVVRRAGDSRLIAFAHLNRPEFVSWMASVNVMVGNSSAGIIEAATFGTPVVNVGDRQHLRERNANVTDVPPERVAISHAVEVALSRGRLACANVYGDGRSADRIVELLLQIPLGPEVLLKSNAY